MELDNNEHFSIKPKSPVCIILRVPGKKLAKLTPASNYRECLFPSLCKTVCYLSHLHLFGKDASAKNNIVNMFQYGAIRSIKILLVANVNR